MATSKRGPIPASNPDNSPDPDALIDLALRAYARSFEVHRVPAGLSDAVMRQVQTLGSVRRGVHAPALRKFMALVARRPDLQQRLVGSGPAVVFVRQVKSIALECGVTLDNADIYALMPPRIPDEDGELSDDQLSRIAAAGAPDGMSFVLQPDASAGSDDFTWSFGIGK